MLATVSKRRSQGETVVHTHGVFDLIHPGTIAHLSEAKRQGDMLVVTVIRDKDVRRGPGRPIFSDENRAKTVAALGMVDYVCIVDDETPYECVQILNPDIFARGQPNTERDQLIHKKIFEEERELYFGKSRIIETTGFSFSSTNFLANLQDFYPEGTVEFLRDFKKRYSFNDIARRLDEAQKLKVLLIGDSIVDEYHYCVPLGKSAKAHLVVNKYVNHEVFPGGVEAIANHLAGVCGDVTLVTVLGKDDPKEDFLSTSLKPNVAARFFRRECGPTVVKKRYINEYLNQKLFEINYINDTYVDEECEQRIIDFLTREIPKHDMVVVADFGHGLLTPRIINTVQGLARLLTVNTQTNGANAGFNLVTRYNRVNFVCLDEPEARFATQDKHNHIREVSQRLFDTIAPEHLIVTLGRRGSLRISSNEGSAKTPVLSTKVVDTVGAGDAFYSFTALCYALDMPRDLISFIGNAAGALAVQIVCNKKSVEKHELLEFIHCVMQVQ